MGPRRSPLGAASLCQHVKGLLLGPAAAAEAPFRTPFLSHRCGLRPSKFDAAVEHERRGRRATKAGGRRRHVAVGQAGLDPPTLGGVRCHEACTIDRAVSLLHNAQLRHDPGDELPRSHIKRWVPDWNVWRGPGTLEQLGSLALLDGDTFPALHLKVKGGQRGGHVERNAVVFRKHCKHVRPDLVGSVPVGTDPVRSHDYRIAANPLHERCCHVVGDEPTWHAFFDDLESG
mmetsp:Transcript_121556/g.330222  ORF Transcript_121556/g.330222 Transcript_121556/m.330222 type:complete len:231 (-) Transcript_121556:524-1216(-)